MAKKKSRRPADPVKKIRQTIERERKKAERKDLTFSAPTDEELWHTLRRVNSPIIAWESWSSSTAAGGTVHYSVGINNPDSFTWGQLYVHVFVGPANLVPVVGRALQCVDARFPRLTQPRVPGLRVDPATTGTLSFRLAVPVGIEPSVYLGNAFLFHAGWSGGTYFDRVVFPFLVT